jgi:hypothetical protein
MVSFHKVQYIIQARTSSLTSSLTPSLSLFPQKAWTRCRLLVRLSLIKSRISCKRKVETHAHIYNLFYTNSEAADEENEETSREEEQLKKNDFAVGACAHCKKNFGTTRSSTTFTASAKNSVHSCANARNSENQCMHALCKLCYETQMRALIQSQPSSADKRCRKRKIR